MFVILSDVLELLLADGTVKWPKDLRYLSLKSGATGDISLRYTNDKLQNHVGRDKALTSLAFRCSSVSFRWRSESNSRR